MLDVVTVAVGLGALYVVKCSYFCWYWVNKEVTQNTYEEVADKLTAMAALHYSRCNEILSHKLLCVTLEVHY